MNTDKLNEKLPQGFTARFWSGKKRKTEDRIYINHSTGNLTGKVGAFILFTDGTYQAVDFDHGYGFENIEYIKHEFSEWWIKRPWVKHEPLKEEK